VEPELPINAGLMVFGAIAAAFVVIQSVFINRSFVISQKQLEMAERPYIAPVSYVFCDYKPRVDHPYVQIENFGHEPARTWVWERGQIRDSPRNGGPDLLKEPRLKIVVPGQTEERVDFPEAKPECHNAGWYYLSSLVRYDALGHRYCTRFCRYLHLPDTTEHLCEDLSTNDFRQDDKCDQYETGLSEPK
jgi:hypothetical protein